MFRNQYDTDVTTFSPAGRLHQVEYAIEAVKQGACSVGLKSNDFVVIASIKRSSNDLASYQQKVFGIDQHLGIVVSGLISDARVLAQYMRSECQNYYYQFNSRMPSTRLVTKLSDKSQYYTQRGDKRPYGVGLLVAAYDTNNCAHLYETQPSGVYFEYVAQAIGARSQSAKTYLEKFYETFASASRDELINHALHALKGASQTKLTSRNVTVGYVGKDTPFTVLENEKVRSYVAAVTQSDDNDETPSGSGGSDEKSEEKDQNLDEEEEAERRKVEAEAKQAEQESERRPEVQMAD